MNSKIVGVLKYFLLLAVAFGLLAFAFRGISVSTILHNMQEAKLSWLLLSAVLSVIAFVVRAYRWNMLIVPLGYFPPLRKTTYALMVGYLANLAFPRLGEVTRCGSLSKTESIPFTGLLGTVIIERVIDLISLFACILLTTFLEYKRLGEFLTANIVEPITGKWHQLMASPVLLFLFFGLLVVICIGVYYFIRRSNQKGKESKLVKLVLDLINGLRSVTKLKRPLLFIFLSIFIWVLYFLSVYVCFFALPSTSHLGTGTALFLLVAGGIAMSAPVQGGIGAYHLLVSEGLMLYGLSQQDGLTFATLVHTLSLLIVVLGGIASLLLLFSENKKMAGSMSKPSAKELL